MAGKGKDPDQVDRALADARRAIGTLGDLLDDEDQATLEKVARAMEEIGPFAVGPLAAALPKARSVGHRLAIIGGLLYFAPQARAPVARALTGVLKRGSETRASCRRLRAHLSKLLMDDQIESATKAQSATAGSRSPETV